MNTSLPPLLCAYWQLPTVFNDARKQLCVEVVLGIDHHFDFILLALFFGYKIITGW